MAKTQMQLMLENKKQCYPKRGFNVVALDDYEPAGEQLHVVKNFPSQEDAQEFAAKYGKKNDVKVFVYGSDGEVAIKAAKEAIGYTRDLRLEAAREVTAKALEVLAGHLERKTKLVGGLVDQKTWKLIERKANQALEKHGFDGARTFRSIGEALKHLSMALSAAGLELSEPTMKQDFVAPSGNKALAVSFKNPMEASDPLPIADHMVRMDWHKFDTGDSYEVTAYLS